MPKFKWKEETSPSPRYPKLVLFTLSIAHFFDDGLVRATSILISYMKTEFNLSYLDIGVWGSVQSTASMAGNPALGYLSDRFGKRRSALILGFFVYFIATAAFGLTRNYGEVLIVLVIAQLASCIYHPHATSVLNYVFTGQARSKLHSAIGLHGAIGAMGMTVYPILMSYAAQTCGWRLSPVITYAPMAIVVMILLYVVLRDPERSTTQTFNRRYIRWFPVLMLSLYSALHTFAFLQLNLFLPLYFSQIKGFSIIEIGLWLSATSIANILGQLLVGFGASRFGTRKLIFATSVFFGACFLMFMSTENYLLQFSMLFLATACNASAFPLMMSVATEIVPKEAVTTVFGITQGITGAVRAVISPIFGNLADQLGLVFTMTVTTVPVGLAGFTALGFQRHERERALMT